jgi:hypothetical protein
VHACNRFISLIFVRATTFSKRDLWSIHSPLEQRQARDGQVTVPETKFRGSYQASFKNSSSRSCTLQEFTGCRTVSFSGQHGTSRATGGKHISQPESTGLRSAGNCISDRSRARPGCSRCMLRPRFVVVLSTTLFRFATDDHASRFHTAS